MGIIQFFTKGGNIGLIARNLAYIIAKIKKDYISYFKDDKSIYITTAFINLSVYIKKGQIGINDILELVDNLKNDTEAGEEFYQYPGAVNDFIMDMERLIFSIDSPKEAYIIDKDTSILFLVIDNIRETIEKVDNGSLNKKRINKDIELLINSNNTELKNILGIK